MARVTPEEAADYQIAGIGASLEKMRKGVERVTESPMLRAIAKKDKMLNNLTRAIQDGTWERGLRSVSLEDWKKAMTEKGLVRVSSGAQNARPKLVAFFTKFLPYVDSAKADIAKMPDLTIEDSANRAAAWVRKMGAYKNK